MNFALKTRKFVSKTRNCVSNTRNCVLKTRNFAVKTLLDLVPPGAYHPPYSVIIFAMGMVCGQLDHSFNDHGQISAEIHDSIIYWITVDPHVIMYGLLPPLLFESAFGVDYHVFVKVAAMAIIMALPGVILATGFTAAVAKIFFTGCCHVGW